MGRVIGFHPNPHLCPPFVPMWKFYPEQNLSHGDWSIDVFAVDREEVIWDKLRWVLNPFQRSISGVLQIDRYVRLSHGERVWMTDTPAERIHNMDIINNAKGRRVLVAGLGIGMLLPPLLDRADHITVIEKNQAVIEMVGNRFDHPKLTIIHDDITTFKPQRGQRFGAIWLDIWADICADNKPEMQALFTRYNRYKEKGGFIGAWQSRETYRIDRQNRRDMGHAIYNQP
jgi:hypothetical protein